MSLTRHHQVALAVSGAVVVAGGVTAYVIVNPMIPRPSNALRAMQAVGGGNVQSIETMRSLLATYADRAHYGDPAHKPATARALPVQPYRASSIPGAVTRTGRVGMTRAETIAALDYIRAELRAADRGDEDPRCVMCRWMIETAWARACQGECWGNLKLNAVYADRSTLTGASPVVYSASSTVPYATSVHILRDGLRSIDLYPDFPDMRTFARADKAWRLANGYAASLDAHRRGGIEGCQDSEEVLATHGYMGNPTSPRTALDASITAMRHQAFNYWTRCQRIAGDRWVR